jgi:hypothetical protein
MLIGARTRNPTSPKGGLYPVTGWPLLRAQHRVDRFLASDPHQGRYLSEGLYWVREDLLIVYYEIDDDAGAVNVTNVYF